MDGTGAAAREADVISIDARRSARSRAGERRTTHPAGTAPPSGRARCSAFAADGRACRNYAVEDGRCRVHALAREDGGTARTPGPSDALGGGERAGRPGDGARDEAWEQAQRAVQRRGWAPAVDAIDALQEATGDRFLDVVRDVAAFVRRRLTGDYEIDEFGFDRDLTEHVLMPLLRPLHRSYWRVASSGVEHLPTTGGGLVVANHAGTLPLDALIARLDILDHTGRHARELAADLVFRTPYVASLSRKTGATLASGPDADRLLAAGELVAVWPEGFKGIGKRWKDRYRLQRFGRGGFVATALRAQVPIVPTAIVGSEEIYPMLYDLRVVARLLGLPYFPVVPQMFALPVLGPFALLPLPSRWVIEYGEPIDTTGYGPDAADDPMVVFELTDRVRDTIQQMLHRNLMGRRSVFL